MIIRKQALLLSSCLSSLLVAAPAFAQQSQPAEAAAEETGGLAEIVVTAQRRSENLQNVPVTVTAQTSAMLRAADIRSTLDLTQVVPGLRANLQASYFQPFIRGVGGSSSLPANESPVAVYIDGMYVALKEANNLELSNIDRIEVLKGPQGTLFGRNATGGAIHIITKTPGNELELSGDASYGRFEDAILNGYIAGPITPTLSASAAIRYQNIGKGYVENIVTGKDFGVVRSLSAMTKLRWEPVSDLVVTGEIIFTKRRMYDDEQGTANAAIAPKASRVAGAIISYTPYKISQSYDPKLSYNDKKYILDARYDIGAVKLVSITAYENGDTVNETDRDRSSAPLQIGANSGFGRQFSEELQLQSNNDSKLKWILGAYYFRNREGYNPLFTRMNVPSRGTLADLASVSGRPGVTWTETNSTQYVRSYAGFGEATYAITDRTNLTAGIRYTKENRRLSGVRDNVTAPPPGTAFVRTRAASVNLSTSFERATWRLALDHHLNDDMMIYASYNRGFRSGAYNPTLIGAQVPLAPEVIDAYEIGAKTEWLDNRLRVNVAGFYYDYRDLHVSVRTPSTGVIVQQNAGGAEVYGLDFDFAAQPTENLTINGGFNLLHAKYTDYANASVFVIDPVNLGGAQVTVANAKGQPLAYAPDLTANIGWTWNLPMENGSRFALSGNYFYTTSYSRQTGKVLGREEVQAYGQLNASVTWHTADDQFFARLWGRNLTNKQVLGSTLDSFAYFYVVQRPITYGITLGFCFNGRC